MVVAISRCLLAASLCAMGLLAVFCAPVISLFYLAVGATEYGHWFVAASLLLALTGGSRGGLDLAATVMAIIAAALFASPTFRALRLARTLPGRFRRNFPRVVGEGDGMEPAAPVFSLRRLWTRSNISGIKETRLAFAERETGPLHLEFYRAAATEKAPCLVVLHTGGAGKMARLRSSRP